MQDLADETYMKLAMREAMVALDIGEVPIGAIIVLDDKVIARAHNEVESRADASAHAEMLCLQRAAHTTGGWRLCGATLYSTLEPCVMCAGAIFLYRVARVVWGAPDIRHGAYGSWMNLLTSPHPTHPALRVNGRVYEEQAGQLLREFFRKKRSCSCLGV